VKRLLHPLDRYVFAEFWRVFVVTVLGFPLLVEVLDLAENIDRYVARRLPRADIALSYVYWLPESMFMVMPAAVLFATVFTVGSLTRHSEITAAKASGISFHRMLVPIFAGAIMATAAGLGIGELVPIGNQNRMRLLQEQRFLAGNDRSNFAFLSRSGRAYQMQYLKVVPPSATVVQVERLSKVEGVPAYVTQAQSGTYDSVAGVWRLARGVTHILPDSVNVVAIKFDSLIDMQMREKPRELRASNREPADMGFRELTNYIAVMEHAGADVNPLRVERMLKIAIPITCLIIVLFGAPLATTTKRGGASYGVGISLATTVLFLLLINLTRAFGGKGVMEPEIAAWLPSIVFGFFGIIMLFRVRT
jgi:lipopolysaccharide export system permease protein